MRRYILFLIVIIFTSCKKEEQTKGFSAQLSPVWNETYPDNQHLNRVEFIDTYEGDLVISYVLDGSSGRVVERRNQATGEVLWQWSEIIDIPYPDIVGDRLYIPSAQGTYYLLNLADGSVESYTPFENNLSNHFYSQYSNNSIHAIIANQSSAEGPLLLRYSIQEDKTDTLADFRAFGAGNGEYIIREFTSRDDKFFVMVEREINSQKEIALFHVDPASNATEELLAFEPGINSGHLAWISMFTDKLMLGGGTKMLLLNASDPFATKWSKDFGPYNSTRGQRIRIEDHVLFDWGNKFSSIDFKTGEQLWTMDNNYLHPHRIGKSQGKLIYLSSPAFEALQNIYITDVHEPHTSQTIFSATKNRQQFWIEDFTATDQTLYMMTRREIKALTITIN